MASMSNALQLQHESMRESRKILLHLREVYGETSRNAWFQVTAELYGTKMDEGSFVNDHVLKMINAIERLAALGIIQDAELSTDLILYSLPHSFSSFIIKFNMNRISATLPDLLNMLREAEVNMNKGKAPVMMVGSSLRPKRKGKSNLEKGKTKSGTIPPRPASFKPAKARPHNQTNQQVVVASVTVARVALAEASTSEAHAKGPCFHCGKPGHWKRNCVTFLRSIGKGMPYVSYIEVNMNISDSSSWILDSGCGTHICSNLQALTDQRNLEKGEGDLRLVDSFVVEVIAIGSVYILLPSG
ncbi:zf-CCHC domain-containing protein/UBN2_2 domain-containing protein [Cephalotus follicularis]|uniref:Zf-CCHC domain-containing protein/UBN2_2 domain-containing protein n=1 Tax=Cephalotus follicularis TaxID=3775 RepID=A0A1Q3B1M5_CEPFO|nr:zf-CCHC domain-containing protein/UBN2_2 domain-containing protein [Cephalotus follicularis]